MRKNTARKWVHLLLDLLPVLIIPIFAIYLINHNPQGLQVEYTEQIEINFNQKGVLTMGNVPGLTRTIENDTIFYNGTITELNTDRRVYGNFISNALNHIFVLDFYINGTTSNSDLSKTALASGYVLMPRATLSTQHVRYRTNGQYNTMIPCFYPGDIGDTIDVEMRFQYFDLTQMFGRGNEPSLDDFNTLFPLAYYSYVESEIIYIDSGVVFGENTDIGSQFIYSLYIPVHDYFNMTNLFNFGDIYNWINTSLFGGNAPLPIFIVYNVIVYEFLIDLIFLIYSIFMFIIDFTSELLARCFSFSNKGGTR